jgi:hypothetical protein
MPHQLTTERAYQIAAYLERAAKYPEKFTKPEDEIASTKLPES